MREHDKLVFDPIPYLLALAFADDALSRYSSLEELWEQEIPSSEPILRLKWKDSMLEQLLLRTGAGRPLRQSMFYCYLNAIVKNAGYHDRVSIHTLRRGLANAVDSKLYS